MAHGLSSVMMKRDNNHSNNNSNNTSKTGIGSRRIFPAQFKLQVLDSYRNDSDCKGNQRATARKYGIHRRQIQKWLQAENNLRNSVVHNNNNNNNNGKKTSPNGVESSAAVALPCKEIVLMNVAGSNNNHHHHLATTNGTSVRRDQQATLRGNNGGGSGNVCCGVTNHDRQRDDTATKTTKIDVVVRVSHDIYNNGNNNNKNGNDDNAAASSAVSTTTTTTASTTTRNAAAVSDAATSTTPRALDYTTTRSWSDEVNDDGMEVDATAPIDLSFKRSTVSVPLKLETLVNEAGYSRENVRVETTSSTIERSVVVDEDDAWDLSTTKRKRAEPIGTSAADRPPVKLFKPYLDDEEDERIGRERPKRSPSLNNDDSVSSAHATADGKLSCFSYYYCNSTVCNHGNECALMENLRDESGSLTVKKETTEQWDDDETRYNYYRSYYHYPEKLAGGYVPSSPPSPHYYYVYRPVYQLPKDCDCFYYKRCDDVSCNNNRHGSPPSAMIVAPQSIVSPTSVNLTPPAALPPPPEFESYRHRADVSPIPSKRCVPSSYSVDFKVSAIECSYGGTDNRLQRPHETAVAREQWSHQRRDDVDFKQRHVVR